MSTGVQFIYTLQEGPDGDPFYVGRTDDLIERVRAHRREADHNGTPKERRIAEIQDRGGQVTIKLRECGPALEMIGKEDLWKVNLEGQGYVLLNSRGGDTCYAPMSAFEGGISVPWTVETFKTVKWVKDLPNMKVGEKSVWINGIQFFKKGQSKLRFWHSTYGNVDVFASTMDGKYDKACKMLTKGTKENEYMIQQWKQSHAYTR